ncbi:MAG: ABC transporter permease subunit [Bdellovibrionota bacterium]
MSKIFVIAARDFKSLVFSPLYLMVAGICTVLWSFIYLRAIGQFAQRLQMSQMQGGGAMNIYEGLFFNLISIVHLILIVAIPMLTMRLLSEEKKSRTFDLLLTSPITSTDIAVGKFLAGLGAATVLLLLSFTYPLMTRLVTEFNWMMLFTSYLGLFLLLGVYVAVGLFASSVTESALLAVILAIVVNFTLWFLGQGADGSDSVVMTIIDKISVAENFSSFVKGTFKISSFVFFLTFISFFVFLAERVVESTRWRS